MVALLCFRERRWNRRGTWFQDKNNLILVAMNGCRTPSARNYPDLPAARGPAQTALPSLAGSQRGWAGRTSGGWPPSATPAASRTSRGPSSHPASADTCAPRTRNSAADEQGASFCVTDKRVCRVPDGRSEPGWCSPSCWWATCSGGKAAAAAGGRCCQMSTQGWWRTSSLNSSGCPAGRCARRRAGRLVWETQRHFYSPIKYVTTASEEDKLANQCDSEAYT